MLGIIRTLLLNNSFKLTLFAKSKICVRKHYIKQMTVKNKDAAQRHDLLIPLLSYRSYKTSSVHGWS